MFDFEELYNDEDFLMHEGVKRKSGRYEYGSGENPFQHEPGFLGQYHRYKHEGLSETEIAKAMGFDSTSKLRAQVSSESAKSKKINIARALELSDQGKGASEIARLMGTNESTVRGWLKPTADKRIKQTEMVIDSLKKNVKDKEFIDIGNGTELQMNISRDRLKKAVEQMKNEGGYTTQEVWVDQNGTGQKTKVLVLCKEGTTKKDVYDNIDKVSTITDRYVSDEDKMRTSLDILPPAPLSSKRIQVRYAEDGGIDKDGTIELRPGVKDLNLGGSKYAQVRISVDGTHYLKGMAVYGDEKDFPEGVDAIFNTNKPKTTPMMGPKDHSVLKPMKSDPDNPFGATITDQKKYIDTDGKEKLSPVNIITDQGKWGEWSKTLSNQVLGKQDVSLVKKQLKLSIDEKYNEFEDIMKIDNPVVKKNLLKEFADDCDSTAVHLKSAGLPRQRYHVIIPINSLKDNEIYAPGYENGESVVLIRFPHGGKFEIPRLTVNNLNKEGKRVISPTSLDAVGINHKVASQLSGADFDGDTVLVIPDNKRLIKNMSPLKALTNFDPGLYYDPSVHIKDRTKQNEMGKITNLITDMTIKGASEDELARAVKHSMVIIDAQKHQYNYKQSFKDNDIAGLQQKYQLQPDGKVGGVSTLLSRSKSEIRVPERKIWKASPTSIDPETGEKIYQYTNKSHDKMVKDDITGEWKTVKKNIANESKSTRMAEVKDAYQLSSGTKVENAYAEYANKLKALANESRKEYLKTPNAKYNATAAKEYSDVVNSLKAQLNLAKANAPYERKAQIIAQVRTKNAFLADPHMSNEQKKKIRGQALNAARKLVGANKRKIIISEREWEAIQKGAVSNNVLQSIYDNSDKDILRKLATPKKSMTISTGKRNLAKSMAANDYNLNEIAERLGISVTSVSRILNGKE